MKNVSSCLFCGVRFLTHDIVNQFKTLYLCKLIHFEMLILYPFKLHMMNWNLISEKSRVGVSTETNVLGSNLCKRSNFDFDLDIFLGLIFKKNWTWNFLEVVTIFFSSVCILQILWLGRVRDLINILCYFLVNTTEWYCVVNFCWIVFWLVFH